LLVVVVVRLLVEVVLEVYELLTVAHLVAVHLLNHH
jgi:hypothetical protein